MITELETSSQAMTSPLRMLDEALPARILDEAFALLMDPGVRVSTAEAQELLAVAGARVEDGVAHIPESLARCCLATVPREFALFDRGGQAAVRYGADRVHFDPGSSCLNILDPETRSVRPAQSHDLVRLIQVTEVLTQFAAQSTAMVCNDVPQEIGDLYRLFLVLWYSAKPVVTGAFSGKTLRPMLDLLAAEAGGPEQLRHRPRAVFDVCPSPPMHWTEFACENLIKLARAGVPAEMVSMPIAGATAPVTLAGSVVQHAAESISGIVIHQLAARGAPIVWGGAPTFMDMSTGGTPMGAIETVMLNLACTQVGKHLGLPTHCYLVATDGFQVDAQAGMESATSAMLGAMAGMNMISGAGMLASLACHSIEKLVLDAEAIASAQRFVEGIQPRGETLALDSFRQTGLSGDFLKLKDTRALFRREQHFPSRVIQRSAEEGGDAFVRAGQRVEELVGEYERPAISPEAEAGMVAVIKREAERVGFKSLPAI
jgi:trimethylamine--corrinoid protein Co-methyltransferase